MDVYARGGGGGGGADGEGSGYVGEVGAGVAVVLGEGLLGYGYALV